MHSPDVKRSIWIGFDPREAAAFAVAKYTMKRYLSQSIPVRGLVLSRLIERGLYKRPMEWRHPVSAGLGAGNKSVMWDVLSEAAMSTQHANARFFVPHLAKTGWAMFCDGDILFRADAGRLFDSLDSDKAVYCVHHNYKPTNLTKMDGQVQAQYNRKNWSSVMVFNCDHPANRALTLELLNTAPGRDLHRFCWLADRDIGELDERWNHLVGHSKNIHPFGVHFTEGVPDMEGYADVEFAAEWRDVLDEWADQQEMV